MRINPSKRFVIIGIMLLSMLFFPIQRGTMAQDKGTTADEQFEKSYSQLLSGDYQAACKTLEKQLKTDAAKPIRDKLLFWLGSCMERLGKYAQAMEWYKIVHEEYPKSVYADDALFQIAEIFERRFYNYEKAIEIYQQVTNEYPDSFRAVQSQNKIGDINVFNRQDNEQALKNFDTAYNITQTTNPNAWQSRYALNRIAFIKENSDFNYVPLTIFETALNLRQQKKFKDAASLLYELIETYPETRLHDDALFECAKIEIQLGNKDQAKANLNRLIQTHAQSEYVQKAKALLDGL